MTSSTLLALGILGTVAGCATYTWVKSEHVNRTEVTKIETPLASEICTPIVGSLALACAIRIEKQNRCVVIVSPNSPGQIEHESAHCFGYDH